MYSFNQIHDARKSIAHVYDRYKNEKADEKNEEAEDSLFKL